MHLDLVSAKSNTPLRRKKQAPASHRCKNSTEDIRSQQPKGTSRRCRKLHISNSKIKLYLPYSRYSDCTFTGFCQVEHPSEEEETSAYQSPMHIFNRRNKKSTTQRDISSISQTKQIELEQKYCIFHILGIQSAP